jgi:GxxExxY protein
MNRQGAKGAKAEPGSRADAMAHAVIGAAIEVHRHLGPGYLESTYEEALAIELLFRDLPFSRQEPIAVDYKGHSIGQARADFLVGGSPIVELKAVEAVLPIHTAQVISYLRAKRCGLGLLINFNVPVLREGVRRVVLS